MQLLQEELKKSPDRQDVRLALANTAARMNNLDLAAQEYRRLIEINPKNFEMYMRLGETLRRKGDTQGSIEVLQMGQKLAPNNPAANLQLALTMEASGQRKGAKPYYELVLRGEPDNPIALNNLAYLMAEEGVDLDQALTYAQRAKQRLPNNVDVADTLGWIYIKKNLSDNAIVIFRELVQQQPTRSTFHYHLAMALFQKGDKPRCKQSLQSALANKPSKEEEARIRELLAKVS
jgi:tetratricopeptide (TPR) repeat protein